MDDNRSNRDRAQWVEDEVFSNEHFVVQVSKLALRRPQFSISISGLTRAGKPVRHIRARYDACNGKVTLVPIHAALREVLERAEGYIERQLQYAQDHALDEDLRRDAQRKGSSQGGGLKKWAAYDKAKREEQK